MLLAERELGYAQFNAFLLEEISIPRRIFVFSNDSLFGSCLQYRVFNLGNTYRENYIYRSRSLQHLFSYNVPR